MKATAALILAAFLVAAAIILLPTLLAPQAEPQSQAGPPSPASAVTLVDPATPGSDRTTLAIESPGAVEPGGAPVEASPAPATVVILAPAASTDAAPGPAKDAASPVPPGSATPDVPHGTPVPASGAQIGTSIPQETTSPSEAIQTATIEATKVVGAKPAAPASGSARIYTGVSMGGVPWDMSLLTNWEKTVAGKSTAIVHYWVFWKVNGAYQPFVPALQDSIRSHGSIPMITWAPEESGAGTNQTDFTLSSIISGKHDAYIKQFAGDARAWGKPFFLRWAHEPDGDWFPWGEDANGNQRGQYAQAWRHVHDVFAQAGATNVTWVWCPNVEYPNSPRPSYASLYPGDRYVDWICVDGYNWGADFPQNGGWSTFYQIFQYAYDDMVQVAPNKPMMLGEWAASEHGGSKPSWIRDAFGVEIPKGYPAIRASVWYNETAGPIDWRIESSPGSAAAYRAAMASAVYADAQYGQLATSPIPPP